jgi:SAM-dependent methyltransferase
VEAARRGCQVTGVDASAPLLVIARQRLPAGRFVQGDLESLPLGEREVHCAIAVNSIIYCDDPASAVRELARVVRPGGRVALTSWGPRERCDMAQVFGAASVGQPAPPPGRGPFAFAVPGALEVLLEQAGLQVRGRGETACPFSYPDLPTAWRAQASAGPMQAALRAGSPDRLRLAVERALLAFKTSQGPLRLNNLFGWAVATKR